MAWLFLTVAGGLEVVFTTFLKLSAGFTRLWPTLGFLVTSLFSFAFLTLAIQTIPLGTAYAVWVGLGAVGTALVGMVWFGDPTTPGRLFFLALIILSIIGLKLVSGDS